MLERGGAQFEEKVGCIPPEYARDLIVGAPKIFCDDGVGNAQGRLSEAIFGIEFCTLGGKEFNDVIQSLIGSGVQCGPAELSDGIHVGAPFHEEFYRFNRRRPFFGRSWP